MMKHLHFLIIFISICISTHANVIDTVAKQERSIANILGKDGMIKKGTSGTFDARGFRMSYSNDGTPIFTPSTSSTPIGNEAWDNTPSSILDNNYVYAITIKDNLIYAAAGESIYKWNGAIWTKIKGLIPSGNSVKDMIIFNDELYIVGNFYEIDNVAGTKGIAKWDGQNWTSVGGGVDGNSYTVEAILPLETDLYVVGSFESAGNSANTKGIAKWDGNNWSALGTGITGQVNAIGAMGTTLYVGGTFTSAGGVTGTERFAKWNGSSWLSVGSFKPASTSAIAISGTDVYVGGSFRTIYGYHISRFNTLNNTWNQVGVGMKSATVRKIKIVGNTLYAAGNFTAAQNSVNSTDTDVPRTANIAKVDLTTNLWSALGTGLDKDVYALATSGNNVYAGGLFTTAGGNRAKFIAKWDEAKWEALGTGINSAVYSVAVIGNDVFVGGGFSSIGSLSVNAIAKWNSTTKTWTGLGDGLTGSVQTLVASGTDLYVGGYFNVANNNVIKNIAKWSTTTNAWLNLNAANTTPINGPVNAITVKGNDVFVGGSFYSVNNLQVNNIAKWNGTTWTALGAGNNSGTNAPVLALTFAGNDLYVGGEFTSAGGTPNRNRIAKWNGTSWSSLGTGADNIVNKIAVVGANVFVSGDFTSAGGIANTNNFAKWSNNTWSTAGFPLTTHKIAALTLSGNELYVFSASTNLRDRSLYKYNGSQWSSIYSFGDSEYIDVKSLAVLGTDIYVGGQFHAIGDKVAPNLIIYQTVIKTTPIQSISLQAKKVANGNSLQWNVIGEKDVSMHEVERAGGDRQFHTIASFSAKNASEASYQWIDNSPLQGNNYYRIKTTDKDGQVSSLSETIIVNFKLLATNIKIYPNPITNGKVNISGTALTGIKKVSLIDLAGRVLQTAQLNFTEGNAQFIIKNNLNTGVYLLKVAEQTLKISVN